MRIFIKNSRFVQHNCEYLSNQTKLLITAKKYIIIVTWIKKNWTRVSNSKNIAAVKNGTWMDMREIFSHSYGFKHCTVDNNSNHGSFVVMYAGISWGRIYWIRSCYLCINSMAMADAILVGLSATLVTWCTMIDQRLGIIGVNTERICKEL